MKRQTLPLYQTPKLSPPTQRTYWVWDDRFLAGAYAGKPKSSEQSDRLKKIASAGIRTVINLMEPNELDPSGQPFAPYERELQSIGHRDGVAIQCLRFPIVDRAITTISRMNEILDAIDESISTEKPVYLHCFGGIGRTGTVVCCWLLKHGHANLENVFQQLTALRQQDIDRRDRVAPENLQQTQFVADWYKNFLNQQSHLSCDPEEPGDSMKSNQSQFPPKPLPSKPIQSNWFTQMVGIDELSPDYVRQNLKLEHGVLTSLINGRSWQSGTLKIPTLHELRERTSEPSNTSVRLTVCEVIEDAKKLHADPQNAGAVFQVASQFNLLEMISPEVTPEQGIGRYEFDATQGPACAIACGAGTIQRNYFVEIDGQLGQDENRQIDCLHDLGQSLGNDNETLWRMENGYALPSHRGINRIDETLREMDDEQIDHLRGLLRVGVQRDTQVTLEGCNHLVTQVYASALPVAYSCIESRNWERFARLVLEAAYEATFAVVADNIQRQPVNDELPNVQASNRLFLTYLGGGAFGNQSSWIMDAIERACSLYQHFPIDVRIVSYRSSNTMIQQLISKYPSR